MQFLEYRAGLRTIAGCDADIPASTPFMTAYEGDGKRYIARQTQEGDSELFELSTDGAPTSALRIAGDLRGVARVR